MTIAEVSKKYDINELLKENRITKKQIIEDVEKMLQKFKTREEVLKWKIVKIVFTEDYSENQLVTSPDEVDKWIKEL